MRILLATPLYPPEIGGPATHAEIVMREFPKQGVEVVLLPFSTVRNLPKILRHIAYFLAVFWKGIGVDTIYALDPVSVGFPAMWAARLLRKRFILRVPGDYAWEQGQQRYKLIMPLDEFMYAKQLPQAVRRLRRIESKVAKKADVVIVPSEYLKRIVIGWGVPESRVQVVYSSVTPPSSIPSREEARTKLGISGHYMVSAGRLVPWKGFSGVIESVLLVHKDIQDVQLGIAGDGPDKEILVQGAKDRNLDAKVTLLGKLPHEELLMHIAAADVFILNTNYEGLSHQLIEVMHAGTPIITTNVGGNTELITDGEEGLLVPYNDIAAIASAVRKLFGDAKLQDSLTQAAKKKAETFTESRMLTHLVPLVTTTP